MKTMGTIADQQRVDVFESTTVTTCAKEDAVVEAETSFAQEEPACTSLKSFREDIYKTCRSSRNGDRTHNRPSRYKGNNSSALDFIMSMGETGSSRKIRVNRLVEHLNLSKSDFDRSNQMASCETYKRENVLNVILTVRNL